MEWKKNGSGDFDVEKERIVRSTPKPLPLPRPTGTEERNKGTVPRLLARMMKNRQKCVDDEKTKANRTSEIRLAHADRHARFCLESIYPHYWFHFHYFVRHYGFCLWSFFFLDTQKIYASLY